MAKKSKMDRIISWPGVSVRIFGDRSGAYIDAGEAYKGHLSRPNTAQLICSLRGKLREMERIKNEKEPTP